MWLFYLREDFGVLPVNLPKGLVIIHDLLPHSSALSSHRLFFDHLTVVFDLQIEPWDMEHRVMYGAATSSAG